MVMTFFEVEYPSYSPELMSRLKKPWRSKVGHKRIKIREQYKSEWIESINLLNNIIVYKWLKKYQDSDVLSFAFFAYC